jgi:fatty acid synthase
MDGPLIRTYLLLGGLSPKACNTLTQRYKDECSSADALALSAHLGSHACQMPWRTYSVVNSLAEASFPDPAYVEKRPNPLVFCFSALAPRRPVVSCFRENIYACDQIHKEYTGHSFLVETGLFVPDSSNTSPLARDANWPAGVISVAITFFQIALFDLLTAINVKPNVIVGHSIGETAVLYASGALPRSVCIVSRSFLTNLI